MGFWMGDHQKRAQRARFCSIYGGVDVAVEASANCRRLRALGATVRKSIDTVIATRCIVSGHELLHADKDFDAFEQHLGLRAVNCGT